MKRISGIGPIPIPQSKNEWIVAGIVIVGGYYFVAKPILVGMGIIKSNATKALDKAETDPNSPLSPTMWQKGPTGTYLLTEATVQKMISTIEDSVNQSPSWIPPGSALWFIWRTDNFNQCFGVFKQCKTQSQVSYLSYKFQQKKNVDMLTWLRGDTYPNDRFSDAHVNEIVTFANQLPKYKV